MSLQSLCQAEKRHRVNLWRFIYENPPLNFSAVTENEQKA